MARNYPSLQGVRLNILSHLNTVRDISVICITHLNNKVYLKKSQSLLIKYFLVYIFIILVHIDLTIFLSLEMQKKLWLQV